MWVGILIPDTRWIILNIKTFLVMLFQRPKKNTERWQRLPIWKLIALGFSLYTRSCILLCPILSPLKSFKFSFEQVICISMCELQRTTTATTTTTNHLFENLAKKTIPQSNLVKRTSLTRITMLWSLRNALAYRVCRSCLNDPSTTYLVHLVVIT